MKKINIQINESKLVYEVGIFIIAVALVTIVNFVTADDRLRKTQSAITKLKEGFNKGDKITRIQFVNLWPKSNKQDAIQLFNELVAKGYLKPISNKK